MATTYSLGDRSKAVCDYNLNKIYNKQNRHSIGSRLGDWVVFLLGNIKIFNK